MKMYNLSYSALQMFYHYLVWRLHSFVEKRKQELNDSLFM